MHARELFDLGGRTALVTGGSRGLGLQIARGLGEMGAKIALLARGEKELEEAAGQLGELGIEALALGCDLSRADAIPAAVGQVLARYGGIDVLVNNAGTNWVAAAEDYPAEAWHTVMRLNIDAVFSLCQEVGRRAMIPQRSGKIINIASIAGLAGNPPRLPSIAYNTSKGALINFTRALAAEWGKYNIHVNAVCPGFFPTRMTRALLDREGGKLAAATPLGRLGGEEDLKGVAVFLASAASRHITGQVLAVDGGASAVSGGV